MANAALTLYRVGTVKETPGVTTFVAVDGGMSDNIRPMLYGARYTMALAGPPRPGPAVSVTVVGKHCETSDILARDVTLPWEPRRGDLLAVAATGAYSYSMASNYNRLGRPAVVGVRDGVATLWLRRETDEDLDRLEVGPPPARARRICRGGMPERTKGHAWRACGRVTVPGVQIPVPPRNELAEREL